MPSLVQPTQYPMGQPSIGFVPDCNIGIRDVWKDNLYEEFVRIRKIIEYYPYIALVIKCFFFHFFALYNCLESILLINRFFFFHIRDFVCFYFSF